MSHVEVHELMQALQAQGITAEHRWVDASGLGLLLGGRTRTTALRYAAQPGFPKPSRVGDPLWNVAEVTDWLKRQREKAA